MRFSIGYQLPDELDSTPELCEDFSDCISDCFFSFGNEPSGRAPLGKECEREDIERLQLEELSQIKGMGKHLTLLLNASCYGEASASVGLKDRVLSLTDRLKRELDIDAVTTASPFIAQCLKEHFKNELEIRASVNMRVGSVSAMRQLSRDFDGFYIRKELNRRLDRIEALKSWADENGKKLYMLANSGCIHECAFQSFHDNIIAHQQYTARGDELNLGYPAPCHGYLKSLGLVGGVAEFLAAGFVRPEEIYLYENYFSEVKLATRMHSRPRAVLAAYCRGKFKGNLLDLTEPSYSHLFRGWVLDNTKISEAWVKAAYSCDHNCTACGACERAAASALCDFRQ